MKYTELRIGNYYNGDVGKGIRPRKTSIEDLIELKLYPKDDYYKPIPLTEEWLLKFGFEENREWVFNKGEKNEWHTILDGWTTDKGGEGFSLEYSENELCFELYFHYMVIKYVHQLQNLYFALTGKELTT